MKYTAVFFLALFAFSSPLSFAAEFSVMTYNVENLWNAIEEADQGDPSYLPQEVKAAWPEDRCVKLSSYYRRFCHKLDWTETKYERKLTNLSHVILSYNEGLGPDILALEELENRSALKDLQATLNRQLESSGGGEYTYEYLSHYESDGYRGIDVGVLSRVPIVEDQGWIVDFGSDDNGDTRDVLEVHFELEGVSFLLFANHWPSQGGKTWKRMKASSVLEEASSGRENVIVVGDFNTLEGEKDEEGFNPVDRLGFHDLGKNLGRGVRKGTYFYKKKKKWNRFDRILVGQDVFEGSGGLVYIPDSFELLKPQFAMQPYRNQSIPNDFDFHKGEGYSDHLAVIARFEVGSDETARLQAD